MKRGEHIFWVYETKSMLQNKNKTHQNTYFKNTVDFTSSPSRKQQIDLKILTIFLPYIVQSSKFFTSIKNEDLLNLSLHFWLKNDGKLTTIMSTYRAMFSLSNNKTKLHSLMGKHRSFLLNGPHDTNLVRQVLDKVCCLKVWNDWFKPTLNIIWKRDPWWFLKEEEGLEVTRSITQTSNIVHTKWLQHWLWDES